MNTKVIQKDELLLCVQDLLTTNHTIPYYNTAT